MPDINLFRTDQFKLDLIIISKINSHDHYDNL